MASEDQKVSSITLHPELLCDDVRQHIISFLGKSIDQIGRGQDPLEAGNKSTFPLLQTSLQVAKAPADTKKVLPKVSGDDAATSRPKAAAAPKTVRSKSIPRVAKATTEKTTSSKVTKGTSSTADKAPGKPAQKPSGGGDDLLTIQLVCKSWNQSFHRTCIDSTHVVVRRAIICRRRCIRKDASSDTDNEQFSEALRDLAEISQQQKEFLAANEAEVRSFEESKVVWASSVDALNCLRKGDICELRCFKAPPARVLMVLQAVLLLLKQDTAWASAKKMMQDTSGFMNMLIHYPRETISPKMLKALSLYTSRPDFTPPMVKMCSVAASALCQWVLALESFAKVGEKLASSGGAALTTRFAVANEIIALNDLLNSTKETTSEQ